MAVKNHLRMRVCESILPRGKIGQMSEMVKLSSEILDETHLGYLSFGEKKRYSLHLFSVQSHFCQRETNKILKIFPPLAAI